MKVEKEEEEEEEEEEDFVVVAACYGEPLNSICTNSRSTAPGGIILNLNV